MKLSLDGATYSQALDAVRGAAGGAGPTIRTVLIEAEADGRVHFTATDTLLQSTWSVDAQVDEAGRISADLEDISPVAKHLPKGTDVGIDVQGGFATVTAGRSQFRFGTLDPETFPAWDAQIGASEPVAVTSDAIYRMFGGVMHAVAGDDGMDALRGVLLTNHGGATPLRAVATDGHRFACCEVPDLELELPADGIILPARAAREALRLTKGVGMIGLAADARVVQMDGGPEILLSKLIDAKYPDYRRLLEQGYEHHIEVDRKMLIEALARVGAILTRQPILKLIVDANGFHLRADRDQTTAVESVELARPDGFAPVELGLNARYLGDALKSMVSPIVRLHYSAPSAPVRLAGAADPGLTQIMMPARV